jgi:hypothetical protein
MPLGLQIIMGGCFLWLLYLDFRLKKAADSARDNAIKSLHTKIIYYRKYQPTKTKQLKELLELIEHYDNWVYKSFMQRPIFIYSILIAIALLIDKVDYAVLMSNLF